MHLAVHFLPSIWKVFCHYLNIKQVLNKFSFKQVFCPFLFLCNFWGSHMLILIPWWYPMSPISFLHLFLLFVFFFLWLDNFKWSDFKFTDSFSAWSCLMLKLSVEFFSSVIFFSFSICLVTFYSYYLFIELPILFLDCFPNFLYLSIYVLL